MTVGERVSDFLAVKRLAVIGVSRAPKDFPRVLFREFAKRAYDVVPVNPGLAEVEGRRCYTRVQEISPAVEGALVLTPPAVTEKVVEDCAEAGIRRVWLYRAVGPGAVSPEAVRFCEARGIEVVAGYCPFLFFPNAGFPHGVHAFLLKITGRYPR